MDSSIGVSRRSSSGTPRSDESNCDGCDRQCKKRKRKKSGRILPLLNTALPPDLSASSPIPVRALFGTPMQYSTAPYASATSSGSSDVDETDEFEVPPETPSTFAPSHAAPQAVTFSRLFVHNMGFSSLPSSILRGKMTQTCSSSCAFR